MSNIVVLTHNPKGKWGDVRASIENNHGYSNWGKSIGVTQGQIVLVYISKSVFEIQYIMQVKNVKNETIDLDLIKKIEPEKSRKLSYELLKQHGLKQATVNYILNNNVELYNYVMSILGDDLKDFIIQETTNIPLEIKNQPLNQILYGPPGTGKTYHTINKALEIIDSSVPTTRKEAKERFEVLRQAGQIEMVTFHQSYGYEEFVEGIKAIPVGEEGNEDGSEMIYKPMAGVFKKFAIMAKNNYDLSKKNMLTNDAKFDILWKKLKDFLLNEITEKEKYFLTEQVYVFEVQDKKVKYKGDNWLRHDQGLNLKYENIKAMYLARVKERKDVKDIDTVESLAKQHATYNLAILEKIYHLEQETNFAQETEDLKNYVLIIDEINRGNISKIFGELITLLEPSKRLGANEALTVSLPYSGESFGIPSNLYIIGTMNTADRSIALMDTALRRRFEFTEMMPDTKELEGIEIDGINIAQLLDTINKRIEYLYDRDHTIGHAYFTSLKESPTLEALEGIFKNKIIPLLQEYFYDDWEKIQMVLGDHPKLKVQEKDKFIVEASQKSKELFGFVHDDIDEQAITYSINEHFSKEAYLKLCAKIKIQNKGEENANAELEN